MTRNYGTGTMSEIRPGVWRFRVSVKDPISGEPVQRSKTICTKTRPAKKALEAQLAAFRRELEQKTATGKKATVGKLLDDWLADLEQEGRAKTTLETYRSHVETRIRPKLGKVALEDMTTDRTRAFVRSLAGQPRTQRLTHAILRAAFAFAMANDWMDTNPAGRVRPAKVAKDHSAALTPAEVGALILAAQANSDAMGMAVLLAAFLGTRRGELCGLRWSDVDWEAETIRIERAWVPGEGGQHLGPTKTDEHRTVSLRGDGMVILRQWRAAQEATYGELGEWLVSDSDGTHPLRAKTVTETFTRLAKAEGIDAHFHDLRHFASTQLQGLTDTKTAAARLGHSPQVALETYGHAIAERDAVAAVALGQIITAELPP